MKFRTEIQIQEQKNSIDYSSRLLLIGSCFTQNIGDKLAYYKFNNYSNPLGVMFHPKAIENLILSSINNPKIDEEDLIFHMERWHCFNAHSDYSDQNKENVIQTINEALLKTNKELIAATHVIITLGTSWIYRYLKTEKIVANCHKIPQKEFQKIIMSVSTIETSLQNIKDSIFNINPQATIIFTVSPVRHLKDGFTENQQSKAHLLSAIHQVLDQKTNYFPAYEIMMDDLRDYRYYKKDMLHPNEFAIDYIWESFLEFWINPDTEKIRKEVNLVQKGLKHKPFNKNSNAHQQFLNKLKQGIKNLKEKGIHFTK